MVRVNFKLSEAGAVSLSLENPKSLDEVLQQCSAEAGVELGGYIAVRAGRVVTGEDVVGNDDVIDVFPAISGG